MLFGSEYHDDLEVGGQLALDIGWSRRLHHVEDLHAPARFALCSRVDGGGGRGRLRQEIYSIEKMEWALRQVHVAVQRARNLPRSEQIHYWLSQSTLRPGATNRRLSSIWALNAVWVDIDVCHPPGGRSDLAHYGAGLGPDEAERLAELLLAQCLEAGLPQPSVILATGGGLCVKWLFAQAVPVAARPRWQAIQRAICTKVAALEGDRGRLWPVDHKACDASRILRLEGTPNPRWGQDCRVVWSSSTAPALDFDDLADSILGYTRADVAAYRASAAAAEWRQWDRNRAAAAAAGFRRGRGARAQVPLPLIAQEAGWELWAGRLEFGRWLIERNPLLVAPGNRNQMYWVLANALAWSASGDEELRPHLAALHRDLFSASGWTRAEAEQSASAVLRRMRDGDEPYRMRHDTYLDALGAAPADWAAWREETGRSNRRRAERPGAMGFAIMRGLSSEDYIAETRRRQAAAGQWIAQQRAAATVEARQLALALAAAGQSTREIGAALAVSHTTVARWINSAAL